MLSCYFPQVPKVLFLRYPCSSDVSDGEVHTSRASNAGRERPDANPPGAGRVRHSAAARHAGSARPAAKLARNFAQLTRHTILNYNHFIDTYYDVRSAKVMTDEK